MFFNKMSFTTILLWGWLSGWASASDWPMYRADAGRSGCSADPLPAELKLQWTYRSSSPRPAWPSSARITYDFAPQPILMDNTVVFGSTVDDSVVALDVVNGQKRWQFFTGGPVRFAAAGWRDRVFVASDDGWLYALALADGQLLWKHRGGPDARMCLGNERMISRWPARGGPVVVDETVYYAAGIWPSGGVYLHALEAGTGRVIWTNDRTGQMLMAQPHGGANAHSGVTPQGYLMANGKFLFAPTGRAVPAAFDRATGELKHYLLQENGSMGGARAMVAGQYIINGGCFLEQETGKLAARAGRGVFSAGPTGVMQFTGAELLAYRWGEIETRDRKGNPVRYHGLTKHSQVSVTPEPDAVRRAALVVTNLPSLKSLFRTEIIFKNTDPAVALQTGLERTLAQSRPEVEALGASVTPFMAAAYERTSEVITAGDEAVCGLENLVSLVDLKANRVRWTYPVEGNAIGLATARGKLLVTTTAGIIYGFAEVGATSAVAGQATPASKPSVPNKNMAEAAAEILAKSGIREGFCLDVACGDGQLALELARQSPLHVIGLESDPAKVKSLRQRLADAGVYGDRVTIIEGKLSEALFPNYFADLIICSAQLAGGAAAGSDGKLLEPLQRPDGGVICLGSRGKLVVQCRGPLTGSGLWTHQNADAANTLCSSDALVRGPLEPSWYHDGVPGLPDRHAQAPAPLFNRGMLIVEGVNELSGVDAYNGRIHWRYPITGVLRDWDGVHHDVGVGDSGSNICLSEDAVFVRNGRRCLKIDLFTGKQLSEFITPVETTATNGNWGYIAYANGLIYGSVVYDEHTVSPRYKNIRMRTESALVFALDAKNGKLQWQYTPKHAVRNNAIAIADERLYLIDRPISLADRITEPKTNGKQGPLLKPGEHANGTLVALDARTGATLWKSGEDIFGTQLAVSVRHGLVLMFYQAVKHTFFKLPSEIGGRMAAISTANGKWIWDRPASYKTRPIINGDTIYAEGGAWKVKTGEEVPWKFQRSYGCGQIAASEHMMLFRSATLGYLDLTRDVGTENFGGIRSSCWFNAIPAGGLVLVPDGSTQCACSYQMQAWLALQPVATR